MGRNLPYAIADELDAADRTVTEALRAGRKLTADEKAHIQRVLTAASEAKADAALADEIDAMRHASASGGAAGAGRTDGLGAKLLRAGLHLKRNPSVTIDGFDALVGRKAPTIPAADDISAVAPTSVAPLGRDARLLWPNMDRRPVEPGTTAVDDFRQSGSRTVTGSVERSSVAAVTEKASLDVTVTAVTEPLKQAAILVREIPNVLLEGERLWLDFFDQEARFQIDRALDAHVLAQILAASPPFGNTGTGLVAQIRQGVAAMRGAGASPNLLVVDGDDAASLDLSEDAAGGLIFPVRDTGSASPVWGLRVVEVAGATDPMILDTRQLGPLYIGALRVDLDPFTGFSRNTTTLRAEVGVLQHVRAAYAARRIAAA
ncbi:hypothetical protein [Blastococcus mobilis]|uniref:HK97 family phage major capsid protein n=1 Tax=Blastococcus mobilis TaxID=1938746 RepID=A0A239AJ47_9ACTN|nr:hypothetical protein [Blastococcus mobilis]SNR95401.1 hypothetical protein SAMN06272737_14610 [Blastococcus mobilis]